jgi:hypothetical protein
MNSAISMLRCIEEHSNIEPLSELYKVEGKKNTYLFKGAVDWMESTFMISLYTLFIRLGAKKISFKDKEDLDSKLIELCKKGGEHTISYLKTILPFIYGIVENRKKFKYVGEDGKPLFEDKSISLFHSYTGIVALANQVKAKKSNQGGHRDLDELVNLAKHLK